MRQNPRVTIGLVVSIFLLFMSSSFVPSITCTIVKPSIDEEFIEVITVPCGIPGVEDHTKKLTQQQYEHLQKYLLNLNARLNTTTSETETVALFNEAIEELNTYGLLPVGMSVTQAQHLVRGYVQSADEISCFGQFYKKRMLENSTNYFCFVAGYSNITQFWSTFMRIMFWLSMKLDNFFYHFPIPWLFTFLIRFFIFMGIWALDYLRPLMLWGEIILYGETSLFSIGLNGLKKWTGYLYGDIDGFTGFKIKLGLHEPLKYFFIGSAVKVQVAPAEP